MSPSARFIAALTVIMMSSVAYAEQPISITQLASGPNVLAVIDAAALESRARIPESDIDTSVDRRAFLRDLFHRVTSGSSTSEHVESWVRFLQDRIAHPAWPPMHDETTMVTDPIWILSHRLGQCGQTNRVLVDGLLSVGIPARVVQLAAHVAAEAYYDGQWRFLDADWLNLGQFVRKADGTIPSTAEIYADLSLLDNVKPNLEFDLYPTKVTHPENFQPYKEMFRHVRLGAYTTPFYLVKTATPEQEHDLTYGWKFYRVETQQEASK